jgi:hypothetical protein
LSAIAALCDVVRYALGDDPSDSWHFEKGVWAVAEKSRRNRYLSVLFLIYGAKVVRVSLVWRGLRG